MAFSDPRYLIILAIIAFVVGKLPANNIRLVFLVIASFLFAAGFGSTVIILACVALISFVGGVALEKIPDGRTRTLVFLGALIATVFPLLFFKYWVHLINTLIASNAFEYPPFSSIVLPVGISFYTFMAIGYLVDAYVGNVEVERNPLRFVAFISFFPTLTAGPIERAGNLLPQLSNLGKFDYDRAVEGLRLILTGFFMKVVIADSLAPYVQLVYSDAHSFGAIDHTLATIYFSFQVYADFAGYSLIAIGSAKLMGIDLMTNFVQPYLSQNLAEYWRRWHISLSSWFRDYVFVPLQFRFRHLGSLGLVGGLIFTFTLVGIWHGAGFKYAIFGAIHGVLVAISTLTFAKRTKFWRNLGVPKMLLHAIRTVLTFITISLTFVIFRADSVSDAFHIYEQMIKLELGARTLPLFWPSLAISVLIFGDLIADRGFGYKTFDIVLRWGIYYTATLAVISVAVVHALQSSPHAQQFIYFKF